MKPTDKAKWQPPGVRAIAAKQSVSTHKQAETALQISETRYRRLFEAAQDGILILDADTGKIADVNPFLTDMLGYPREEFLGKRLWEIGPFVDVARSKAAFLELLTKRYIRYEDLPLQTRDGRSISVEFVSNVYRVDHKEVIQCNIRDITDRVQAEAAEKELIRMNDGFVASVSHELRTPLASIKGFLDLLRKGKVEDPIIQQEFLTRAAQDVDRLIPLVSDLLDTSQIEAGRLQLDLEGVEVGALISEVLESLASLAGEKVIAMTYDSSQTPLWVMADRRRLRQVLINLIGNAIKFSEAHRPILVTGKIANDLVTVSVIDQGPGISEGQQGLFEKYSRLGKPSNHASHGTGLGLYISKQLIEAHGGHIGVESEPGKGSTFFFVLPAYRDTEGPN